MRNEITSISGYIVKARMDKAGMYERVLVGESQLNGEIIKITGEDVIIQVYENTRGLGIGENVENLGSPVTAFLGTGLLGNIFDGLQLPLDKIAEAHGNFFTGQSTHCIEQRKENK